MAEITVKAEICIHVSLQESADLLAYLKAMPVSVKTEGTEGETVSVRMPDALMKLMISLEGITT